MLLTNKTVNVTPVAPVGMTHPQGPISVQRSRRRQLLVQLLHQRRTPLLPAQQLPLVGRQRLHGSRPGAQQLLPARQRHPGGDTSCQLTVQLIGSTQG